MRIKGAPDLTKDIYLQVAMIALIWHSFVQEFLVWIAIRVHFRTNTNLGQLLHLMVKKLIEQVLQKYILLESLLWSYYTQSVFFCLEIIIRQARPKMFNVYFHIWRIFEKKSLSKS